MGFLSRILNRGSAERAILEALPVTEARFTALDTELTGLDKKKDTIISIGAIKMSGGRIDIGKSFYQLVNPGMEMGKDAIVVHEITPAEVKERPTIDSVMISFLEFCSDSILLGHFISIDLAFINREAVRMTGAPLKNHAVDTMMLFDWLKWNNHGHDTALDTESYQLHEIAKALGIAPQGAHNAMMDAFMTAQVFQRLIPRLERHGVRTMGRLLEVGNPGRKPKNPGMVI
jgi:DNA polymerase-3 subunit epsilon